MQRKILFMTLWACLFLASTTACTEGNRNTTGDDKQDTIPQETSQPAPDEPDPPDHTATDTANVTADQGAAGTQAETPELPPAGKDSRIAYINSMDILDNLPAVKQAEAKLEDFAKGLDQELRRQQQLFQQKYTQYMQDTAASQAIIQTRSQEMQQMQQRILKLQEDSEQELARRKDNLYEPILNKIDSAIKKVAKDKGYTHVLDITGGSLVYAEETTDITGHVKEELGL